MHTATPQAAAAGHHPAATAIADSMRAELAERAAKRETGRKAREQRKTDKEAAAVEKERLRVAKQDGIAKCVVLAKRVPPEFQQWGAVRTRAWLNALKLVQRIAKSKRGTLVAIETAISDIERAATVTIEQLAADESARREAKADKRRGSGMSRMAKGMRP